MQHINYVIISNSNCCIIDIHLIEIYSIALHVLLVIPQSMLPMTKILSQGLIQWTLEYQQCCNCIIPLSHHTSKGREGVCHIALYQK